MEGARLDTLFEDCRKPAAVKVGNGSHIASVTQTSGITTPRHQHGRVLKGRAVVRYKVLAAIGGESSSAPGALSSTGGSQCGCGCGKVSTNGPLA
jgi:hypothetical protein